MSAPNDNSDIDNRQNKCHRKFDKIVDQVKKIMLQSILLDFVNIYI